jgi:hypothetical protein
LRGKGIIPAYSATVIGASVIGAMTAVRLKIQVRILAAALPGQRQALFSAWSVFHFSTPAMSSQE